MSKRIPLHLSSGRHGDLIQASQATRVNKLFADLMKKQTAVALYVRGRHSTFSGKLYLTVNLQLATSVLSSKKKNSVLDKFSACPYEDFCIIIFLSCIHCPETLTLERPTFLGN